MTTYKIIKDIKESIKKRQTREVYQLLDNLDAEMKKRLENLEILGKFFDDIKRLARDLGKTNMISKGDIEELIFKTDGELKK